MSSSSPCAAPDRRVFLAAAALAPLAAAWAQEVPPPEVVAALPQATLRGSGRLHFLGLPVYDARLWAASAVAAGDWARRPLALALTYVRAISGRRIAERSLDEFRRQQAIDADTAARWLDAMRRLFPDVAAGDRLTGVFLPGEGARFSFNGEPCGEVRDAVFARLFFGIWLAPQTSEPGLRAQLLGVDRAR